MIFFSLFGCILIFLFTKSRRNVLLDPYTVFFISLLYYGFLIPICMVIFNEYLLPFQSYEIAVTGEDINRVSLLLFAGYLAFAIGYRLLVPPFYLDDLIASVGAFGGNQGATAQRFLGWFATGLFAICLIFFSRQLLAVFSGYESKIEARYDASSFVLVYNLFLTTFCGFAVTSILYKKRFVGFTITIVVALFVLSLATFSKEPMVYAAIILLAFGARTAPSRQLLTCGAAIAMAALLLIFVVPAFSIYRATGELAFTNPAEVPLTFLFSDANGPFSSIVLAVREQAQVALGPLYESFTLWVPRWIWADRPLDAAEEYARGVMMDWQPGFGLGFSPFAEAHIRYGLAFSPILMLIAGLFMAGTQRLIAMKLPTPMVPGLVLIMQGYTLFTAHRGAFSGLVTAMAQFWIPFLVIFLAVEHLRNPSSRSVTA